MGTTWSARIAGAAGDGALAEAARRAVQGAFDAVVARLSTFDEASEVSRISRHASQAPLPVSAETLAVLASAAEVSRASQGAFDVSVAPLVGAWGFGAGAAARNGAPDAAALAAPVGWHGLTLDMRASTVAKADPALRIDLSGIAKGHAVDRAAAALESLGVQRYLVEAGGEIRTSGLNAEGRPWQVAVERPDAWPQQVHRVVPLAGLAMATSGDYRNFYEWQGRRYCHEIDPRRRAPVDHAVASVSVVHEDCRAADAWATALIVLGAGEGFALAQRERLAALFIVRGDGGRFHDVATPAFAAFG
jgi:thiamine biosynthesis lipoprotein